MSAARRVAARAARTETVTGRLSALALLAGAALAIALAGVIVTAPPPGTRGPVVPIAPADPGQIAAPATPSAPPATRPPLTTELDAYAPSSSGRPETVLVTAPTGPDLDGDPATPAPPPTGTTLPPAPDPTPAPPAPMVRAEVQADQLDACAELARDLTVRSC